MNGAELTIVGNATREPELRFLPNGSATSTFAVAVNRVWFDRNSQKRNEVVTFFDIVCWGTLAENVASCVTKGQRVVVRGRLDQRSWETEDGGKRTVMELTADEVGPSLLWATCTTTRNDRRVPERGPAAPHAPSPKERYTPLTPQDEDYF